MNEYSPTIRRFGEIMMLNQFFAQLKSVAAPLINKVCHLVLEWTKPLKETLVGGIAHDAVTTKTELVVENTLLRQQLIVLKRQVKRPQLKGRDRLLLVVLASKLRQYSPVQPDAAEEVLRRSMVSQVSQHIAQALQRWLRPTSWVPSKKTNKHDRAGKRSL